MFSVLLVLFATLTAWGALGSPSADEESMQLAYYDNNACGGSELGAGGLPVTCAQEFQDTASIFRIGCDEDGVRVTLHALLLLRNDQCSIWKSITLYLVPHFVCLCR